MLEDGGAIWQKQWNWYQLLQVGRGLLPYCYTGVKPEKVLLALLLFLDDHVAAARECFSHLCLSKRLQHFLWDEDLSHLD